MPSPASASPSAPLPNPRWRATLFGAVTIFLLLMVLLRWDGETGFTSLIQFGDDWAGKRLPVLRGTPLASVPDGGYDGQFYAQIAVSADVTSPDLHRALDDPQYRSRRILLPLVAHYLGGGGPFVVLQVFALLNVFCWFALAVVWWKEIAPHDGRGSAVWTACLLSLGSLDSVRLSLTDLPSTLCLVLAARAVAASRGKWAVLWLLAAGFIRETSVLGVAMLRFDAENSRAEKLRAWGLRVLCVAPVAAWCLWLWVSLPGDPAMHNFAWPSFGVAKYAALCVREIAAGNFDSRYTFGLVGAAGMAYQSLFLLSRWREGGVWVRLGVPFALLFWCLDAYVFSGYWAAARACLPMTFAFNRLLPRDRAFWPCLVLGNLYALHGIWRMLP